LEPPLCRWHRRAGPPACSGGPKKGGPQALGRSQGGFSTKIHLRAERGGKPIVFTLTGGERKEQLALPTLLESGAVKRQGRGRPRLRPDRLAGDKGYSSRTVRRYLRRRGIGDVIAHRSSDPPNPRFDRVAYRERNQVERLINRFKQYRRVATRYEKLAVRYLAVITIAAILMWL
jgi:transposase